MFIVFDIFSEKQLHDHTEASVKRREPGIQKLATSYNNLCIEATQGEPRTNHHTRELWEEGRIGFDCLSINPKRARMGSLLVLDCTLYILEYMWAARGYP